MVFGIFDKKNSKSKSSKRSNRSLRNKTSKRRTNRRRQRGGYQSELAAAYGAGAVAAGASDGAEAFKAFEGEGFTNHTAGAPAPPGAPPKQPQVPPSKEAMAAAKEAMGPAQTGGARRRNRKGRKNFATGEVLTAAALAGLNFYGPGSKSRRNRRKSRKSRTQRRK